MFYLSVCQCVCMGMPLEALRDLLAAEFFVCRCSVRSVNDLLSIFQYLIIGVKLTVL